MDRRTKVIGFFVVLLTISGPSCFADDDLESDRFEDEELLYRPRVGYLDHHVHLEIPSTSKDKPPKLEAKLGRDSKLGQPSSILFHSQSTEFTWDSQGIQLQISRLPNTNRCHEIKWTSTKKSPLRDCFEIGRASWYGGPEYVSQAWPVEKQRFQRKPYVRNYDVGKAEPFWFNSKGISIYVNESTPLFYTVEGGSICLIADNEEPYLPRDEILLQYTLCNFDNPRQAYEYSVDNFFDHPAALPDRRMVEFPVWATKISWSDTKVNQTTVLQFAKDIMMHGFNYSQMEISDNGASCYGTTVFNTSLFPDMKMLTTQLKNMGFRTTMRTHPFVDEECLEYGPLKDKGYFVVNERDEVGMHWWEWDRRYDWESKEGLIDFTKHSAQQWFVTRHRKVLDDYGIDGFKIDNIFNLDKIGWLSKEARLNCPVEKQPYCYIQSYVETLAELGPITETHVSFRTQRHAMFVHMLDKKSIWEEDGIRDLITSVFVHNLNGYPFVIPDVVGGSKWSRYQVTKEIFIRWLQAICFMPVIQFTTAPWDFDEQTVEISKELTALHYRYSGVILELMQRSVDTGAPLNTPIWWVDPENDVAHKIDDEYMLGEDILVAPVLEVGATARDIYLPQGYWREENHRHRVFEGRQWIKNYPAGLKILPYFTRVHEYALSSEQKRKIHRRDKIQLITV